MRLKDYIIFLSIFLTLSRCTTVEDSVNEEDIQYVNSIKKSTQTKTIATLDSLLLFQNLTTSQKALINFEKGKLLSILQRDKEASNSFEKALKIFQKLNNQEYIAETYWHLGSSYAFLSEKVTATEYLLKALELNKHIKDNKLEANIFGSLAHVHFLYNDYEKAIDYTLKAITIQKQDKDSLGLSATYNNLAVIYKNIAEYENALIFNKKSLALNKLLKDDGAIAMSYNNIGQTYEQISMPDSAKFYYNKAIELNSLLQNANTSAIRNLAYLYLSQRKYKQAKNLLLEALVIESQNNRIGVQEKIYDKLLTIAVQNKNFSESLSYQQKRDSLSSLLNRFENAEKLKLLENQYQVAIAKNEIQKEKQQNKISKIIFGIIIFLLLAAILFGIQFYKNKTLKEEKQKVILEQKVLRSQMNPHFIFNALSSIQNSLLDNEPIKSASYISKFAKLIRQNFDFINEKTIPLSDEIDALQNYMDTQKMRYPDKFDYEINIFADVDMDDVKIPPLLLQPLVENAIEHGFKNKKGKGKISINISRKKDLICYEIKDNGKGFSNTKGDGKQHSIDIFKKRLKLLDNDTSRKSFKINSSEEGTTVNFCIK